MQQGKRIWKNKIGINQLNKEGSSSVWWDIYPVNIIPLTHFCFNIILSALLQLQNKQKTFSKGK